LSEIIKLEPIVYRYKKDNAIGIKETEKDAYGFSAQDVQKIFPEAVGLNKNGYLDLDMHPIYIAEINAIKELKGMIDKLTKENITLITDNILLKLKAQEIDQLKTENQSMKSDIEKIKMQLNASAMK